MYELFGKSGSIINHLIASGLKCAKIFFTIAIIWTISITDYAFRNFVRYLALICFFLLPLWGFIYTSVFIHALMSFNPNNIDCGNGSDCNCHPTLCILIFVVSRIYYTHLFSCLLRFNAENTSASERTYVYFFVLWTSIWYNESSISKEQNIEEKIKRDGTFTILVR